MLQWEGACVLDNIGTAVSGGGGGCMWRERVEYPSIKILRSMSSSTPTPRLDIVVPFIVVCSLEQSVKSLVVIPVEVLLFGFFPLCRLQVRPK